MIGISIHAAHQVEPSEVVYVATSVANLMKVVAFARQVEVDDEMTAVISIDNVRLSVTPHDWRRIADEDDASRVISWFASHPELGSLHNWR